MTPAITAGMGSRHDLMRILRAREQRTATQLDLQTHFGRPLLSVTVVMPGAVKDGPVACRLMEVAQMEVRNLFRHRVWRVLSCLETVRAAGPEAIYAVDAPDEGLKVAAMALEDTHPLGRLWDLDVIAKSMRAVSRSSLGRQHRPCLVCDEPARFCARARRHSLDELLAHIEQRVHEFDRQSGQQTADTAQVNHSLPAIG